MISSSSGIGLFAHFFFDFIPRVGRISRNNNENYYHKLKDESPPIINRTAKGERWVWAGRVQFADGWVPQSTNRDWIDTGYKGKNGGGAGT